MSNTPRTDEIIKDFVSGDGEAASIMLLRQDVEQLETELAEARAEIERKDRLVEQMREALAKLIGTLEVMSVMPETLGKYPVLAIDAPELEQARAALAAERGE